MLDKKIEKALNEQHDLEVLSAYIYYSMAAWCDAQNWPGFANWLRMQAAEEMIIHAMKINKYVNERGGALKPGKIAGPPNDFASLLDVFEQALAHEVKVTKSIYKLAELAEQVKDRATLSFLQWFIDEQVEEENQTEEIVIKLKKINESNNGLFMLDHGLSHRKFGGE